MKNLRIVVKKESSQRSVAVAPLPTLKRSLAEGAFVSQDKTTVRGASCLGSHL
jgi:hypothetical protein